MERLSVPARQVLVRARNESEQLRDGLALNSGHLVVALASRVGDQAERALSAVGATPILLRSGLKMKDPHDHERGHLGDFGADLAAVLRAAVDRRPSGTEVTTADLLFAVIDAPGCVGRGLLLDTGVDLEALRLAAADALVPDDPAWVAESPRPWTITIGTITIGEADPDTAWSPERPD